MEQLWSIPSPLKFRLLVHRVETRKVDSWLKPDVATAQTLRAEEREEKSLALKPWKWGYDLRFQMSSLVHRFMGWKN